MKINSENLKKLDKNKLLTIKNKLITDISRANITQPKYIIKLKYNHMDITKLNEQLIIIKNKIKKLISLRDKICNMRQSKSYEKHTVTKKINNINYMIEVLSNKYNKNITNFILDIINF